MSKGGSQTTTMELPEWLAQPARRNIGRAEEISTLGYMPNFGPQVAAFAPQQVQAMKNQSKMANAYGMGGAELNIPKAQEFAGGISGYSSMPLFREMRNEFKERRPGQFDAYTAQFINPITGAAPKSDFAGLMTQAVDANTGIIGDSGVPLSEQYGEPDGSGGTGDGDPGAGPGTYGGDGIAGYGGSGSPGSGASGSSLYRGWSGSQQPVAPQPPKPEELLWAYWNEGGGDY